MCLELFGRENKGVATLWSHLQPSTVLYAVKESWLTPRSSEECQRRGEGGGESAGLTTPRLRFGKFVSHIDCVHLRPWEPGGGVSRSPYHSITASALDAQPAGGGDSWTHPQPPGVRGAGAP
ncbi:unnamed protein product [Pleuronectes platessa]|uniref:Uncharacterized protein n=1 Tax=Pleuronectes platessa TaxID=8262 RepID=A0A9N7TXM2_PLEPL|nr:unnamed protein product [Pleuronectes platessa]